MTDAEGLDILVVGGGVTGAGIAVDAASRGLRTGIVEMGDWAAGTSSWSSKLVHGGLRYLYQLDFPLVAEALAERGRLLTETAPHLVKAQPFLWPLKHEVERAYSAVGVGMYDALALLGARGKATVPVQHHLTAKGTKRLAPSLDTSGLAGAIKFYDARVDDSRLVITLVRTAVEHGALAASRTKVVEYLKNDHGRVIGARVEDLEASAKTGKKVVRDIYSRRVINATGVWTEQTQELAGVTNGLKVLASKGIHIVVPKEAIEAETGIFLRTEKSVLFIIPWPRYWVIGTTDTAWHENIDHPVATSADIDYVLEHANAVLEKPISRKDIIGVYAGLRPLLQPGVKEGESGETASTKVSREHTVTEVAPGLTSIAGGKLTTYRVMAADAVDEDSILMAVLDAGAEEVVNEGEGFSIYCEPNDVVAVRTALTEAGMDYDSAEVQFVAGTKIEVDADTARKVMRLIDALEDSDDVQNVFTSMDISAEVAAELDADED